MTLQSPALIYYIAEECEASLSEIVKGQARFKYRLFLHIILAFNSVMNSLPTRQGRVAKNPAELKGRNHEKWACWKQQTSCFSHFLSMTFSQLSKLHTALFYFYVNTMLAYIVCQINVWHKSGSINILNSGPAHCSSDHWRAGLWFKNMDYSGAMGCSLRTSAGN